MKMPFNIDHREPLMSHHARMDFFEAICTFIGIGIAMLILTSPATISLAVVIYAKSTYDTQQQAVTSKSDAIEATAQRQGITVTTDKDGTIKATSPCPISLDLRNNQLVVKGSNVVASYDKLTALCASK